MRSSRISTARRASGAHEHPPLLEAVDAEYVVVPARLAHRRRRLERVQVARVEDRVVRHRREPLGETLVHRVWIGAGQVGPTAALEEEGVAGHELAVDEEALAARRV